MGDAMTGTGRSWLSVAVAGSTGTSKATERPPRLSLITSGPATIVKMSNAVPPAVWIDWVLPDVLARAARPGYSTGFDLRVARQAVDAWVERARSLGIASVICLLDQDQLPLYDRALPDGLLAHYEASGFAVAHIPTPDGRTHPYTPEQLEAAWQAFQSLPRPVLVHCSAGVDRTGRIVRHLLERLGCPHPPPPAARDEGTGHR